MKETCNAFGHQRQRLVNLICRKGIDDPAVLEAMRRVPREEFVPQQWREQSYQDTALPIDRGQTISQPYVVAMMAMALQLREADRILEVGTGSGYAAAVLAELAGEVYTIERDELLVKTAASRLKRLGYENVHCIFADGSIGCSVHAPFDAIIVAAAGPEIPEPLKQQLCIGGRLVIPVGGEHLIQKLLCVEKVAEDTYHQKDLCDVRFVPLVGAGGWDR